MCTTPAMPPLFGAYGHYEVVVTPADATHGQRIVTTELTPGTAAQVVTVPGVPLLPAVTVQPVAQSVWAGDPVTFSATVTGSRPLTAQWQVSTAGGTSWANITGATQTVTAGAANVAATVSTTLATTAAGDDGHQYRVFLTNGGENGAVVGNATSSAARLTVLAAPSVGSDPTSVTVASGATTTMTASADGPAGVAATALWQTAPSAAGPWTDVDAAQVATSGLGHVTSTLTVATDVPDGTNVRVAFSFAPPAPTPARTTTPSEVAVVTRTPPPATSSAPPTTAEPLPELQ